MFEDLFIITKQIENPIMTYFAILRFLTVEELKQALATRYQTKSHLPAIVEEDEEYDFCE
jgi:hypothetical protein